MKNSFWLWFPRIVVMLIIVFLSMFSADLFDERLGFWQLMLGLLMHNIPSIILLLILILTWKKPLLAGLLIIAIGIIMTIYFRHYTRWDIFFVIEFPVLLVGGSYLVYEFLVKDKSEKDENKAGYRE